MSLSCLLRDVHTVMRQLLGLGLFTILQPCSAAIYESFSAVPEKTFDFIVVGAGTAGAVVANRLSANPSTQVLLLEGGVSNQDALILEVPFFCPRPANTIFDWNFTTIEQRSLNNRILNYTRGHVLGGSSSINYMVYTRGSKENWDTYADLTGDEGWSWNALLPYFKKNEIWTEPADKHNTTGEFNPSVHGFHGINAVSLPGFPRGTDDVILETAKTSTEFPFNEDMNSGNMIGVGWTQATIKKSMRSSSATSYLGAQFITRRNLHVVLNARVARVLPSPEVASTPVLTTVEFSDGTTGVLHKVSAKNEVILTAGTLNTPQILLNSGIGPASELSKLGIRTIIDNPSVGKNLSDHSFVQLSFQVATNDTFDDTNRDPVVADAQLRRWNTTGTGPLVDPVFSQIGWFRLPDDDPIFTNFTDPSRGRAPHFEFLFADGLLGLPLPPTGHFFSLIAAFVSPLSRGSVSITNNPFAPPIIDLNYYDSPFDLYVTRHALRSAMRFVSSPPWQNSEFNLTVLDSGSINATAASDEELDEFIRENTQTIFHAVGTAAMTPGNARYGVVDPDLTLKGAKGISVVDVSVLPFVPTAHTQAPAYVIGERASDLILKRWSH